MSATAKPIANTRSATGIPTARLITWWVIASEIVIFGGLLASYVMHRIGHPEWAESASHTLTWAGAFNTFVLLTSSLCAVLAHKAADAHDGPRAAKLLRLTVPVGGIDLPVRQGLRMDDRHPRRVRAFLRRILVVLLHAGRAARTSRPCGNDHHADRCGGRGEKSGIADAWICIGLYWHFVDIALDFSVSACCTSRGEGDAGGEP